MSDKKKNLPASVTSTTDVLSVLKKELEGLQSISSTQYKTSGKIEGFPNSIDTETKIENLVRMWASIQGRAKAYAEAQLDLDIKSLPVFKMSDSLPEDFKHDIQLKIKILTHAERQAQLESLIKEGEAFLTKEDQQRIYLDKVKNAFSK